MAGVEADAGAGAEADAGAGVEMDVGAGVEADAGAGVEADVVGMLFCCFFSLRRRSRAAQDTTEFPPFVRHTLSVGVLCRYPQEVQVKTSPVQEVLAEQKRHFTMFCKVHVSFTDAAHSLRLAQ